MRVQPEERGNGGYTMAKRTVIKTFRFSRTEFSKDQLRPVELQSFLQGIAVEAAEAQILWLCVQGLDPKVLKLLRNCFDLPDSCVAECIDTEQAQKVDGFGMSNLFFIFRIQGIDPDDEACKGEQISVFYLAHQKTIITVQEGTDLDCCWDKIREKLGNPHSLIRSSFDASFMLYAITDAVVDMSFPILERFSEQLHEVLQDMMGNTPSKAHLFVNSHIRGHLVDLRMNLWRVRELLTELMQDEYKSLTPLTKTYMRDVYDHTENNVEVLEAAIAQSQEIVEVYGAHQSSRLSNIMKMLVVVSIFILPAQFVCSLYSRNSQNPQVYWEYGYPLFWFTIFFLFGIIYLFLFWDVWFKPPRRRKRVASNVDPSSPSSVSHDFALNAGSFPLDVHRDV